MTERTRRAHAAPRSRAVAFGLSAGGAIGFATAMALPTVPTTIAASPTSASTASVPAPVVRVVVLPTTPPTTTTAALPSPPPVTSAPSPVAGPTRTARAAKHPTVTAPRNVVRAAPAKATPVATSGGS